MKTSPKNLQFKIIAVVLATLVLLAALNEFLRTASSTFSGLQATLVNLGSAFVFFLLNFWYIHRQTQPLSELTAVVEKIAAGDLSVRAGPELRKKVGSLAESLDRMAEQLSQKIKLLESENQVKKQFISIMSHNLQTPLTIIRGLANQLLEEKEGLSPDQIHTLEAIGKTIKNLTEMNARLLTTIELQGEAVKLNKVKKDLGPLVGSVVREFRSRAEEKQITLDLNVAREDLTAEFDEEWLKVVLENLLDNALKYTPDKGKVTVSAWKTHAGEIALEVADTGIGIPKKEQDKIFLPFRRSRGVLRADVKGVGVGLYIVKMVVEKHNGRLELESEEGRGTKIRIILPPPAD